MTKQQEMLRRVDAQRAEAVGRLKAIADRKGEEVSGSSAVRAAAASVQRAHHAEVIIIIIIIIITIITIIQRRQRTAQF